MIVTEKDTKFVYAFEEGQKEMVDLLGGKGSNLAEMTRLGLPVPSGFTISTQACLNYLKNNKLDSELILQIEKKVEELEIKTNKKFNDLVSPLLVSVRSGAKFSMPGMMDTVLNLGMNDVTVETIAKITGDRKSVV